MIQQCAIRRVNKALRLRGYSTEAIKELNARRRETFNIITKMIACFKPHLAEGCTVTYKGLGVSHFDGVYQKWVLTFKDIAHLAELTCLEKEHYLFWRRRHTWTTELPPKLFQISLRFNLDPDHNGKLWTSCSVAKQNIFTGEDMFGMGGYFFPESYEELLTMTKSEARSYFDDGQNMDQISWMVLC